MLFKYCILVFVIFSAVNCQNNYRVKRQGSKGGRQPSPGFVSQEKIGGYGPSSGVGAGQRERPFRPRPREDEGQVNSAEGEANPEPPIYGGVMGTPGIDFPAYAQIPRTSFKCSGVPYEPGMYADQETQCQAYHVCFQGRKESFLCGVGTVFNQAILACDYWHSVDCDQTPNFYSVNEELGKAGPEPSPGQTFRPAGPRPSPQTRPKTRPTGLRPPSPQRPDYGREEGPDYGQEALVPQPIPQVPVQPQPPRRPPPPRPQPVPQPQRPQSKVGFKPQRPYEPPRSSVVANIPRRPPTPSVKSPYQPQPQPGYRPQPQPGYRPQPQPEYRPQPQPGYRPQPQPGYRPQPQPEYRPQPQPGYRPSPVQRPQFRPQQPRPAPLPRPEVLRPRPPVGKPSFPPSKLPPPPPPIDTQIVQSRDEDPIDDSWLARESSERQQSPY